VSSERITRERNTRQSDVTSSDKTSYRCHVVLGVIGLVVWVAWSRIAVQLAPKKQGAKTRSEAATVIRLLWSVVFLFIAHQLLTVVGYGPGMRAMAR
jgi:hypothetical protein